MLQLPNAVAHGRSRDAQGAARGREALAVDDLHEVSEVIQVKHGQHLMVRLGFSLILKYLEIKSVYV